MPGTAKVIISFAPNGENEGKTVELGEVEAAELVREGRARYLIEDDEKASRGKGKADTAS